MELNPVKILLIEDNEGDILLIEDAFEDSKLKLELSVIKDGELAMEFFIKEEKKPTINCPDLILLDVNLPKKNGHELLKFLKGTHHLKHIPVIMLTTSSSEKDIKESYENHANCYITKPIEADDFLKVVSTIENFWICIVKLPKKPQ